MNDCTYQGLETLSQKSVTITEAELARLRAIEVAALHVASSRRKYRGWQVRIVVDQVPLDALDQALQARS